jgi:Predicted nucleic-acid-binding protein containing a Zn-ribbon
MVPEIPAADDVTALWWEATKERRLLVQRCGHCGAAQHPPRALCTGCGRMDGLTWVEATGRGTVDTWTAVYRAPRPGVDVPYVIARVALEEGPILLTRLVGGDPESWQIGETVEVDWWPAADGRALPVFRRPSA